MLCAVLQKLAFAGKLSDPSLAEGAGILISVAGTATELFINKGITYLATIGVEPGTYYASEAMKVIICEIKNKHNPRLKIWGTSWLTSFQQRFRPNYRYKTDRSDLERLESSLPQKEVGPFPDTITLRPTMLLNNN